MSVVVEAKSPTIILVVSRVLPRWVISVRGRHLELAHSSDCILMACIYHSSSAHAVAGVRHKGNGGRAVWSKSAS